MQVVALALVAAGHPARPLPLDQPLETSEVSGGDANEIPCTVEDIATARIRCRNQVYSFGEVRATNGSNYFIADGPDRKYQYALTLLPQAMPHAINTCRQQAPSSVIGAMQGRYDPNYNYCYSLGALLDAQWILDTASSPQVIRLKLAVREDRATTVDIICDPKATSGLFTPKGELTLLHYLYELRTKAACPPDSYVCKDSQCVLSDDGHGVTEDECKAICESEYYRCVDNKCVPSSTGVPIGKCRDICNPSFLAQV